VTRAAERLFASQPAVSAQIKALEGQLGVALFLRTPAGMQLTDAGRQLLDHARRVLDSARVLEDHARSLAGGSTGTLRVGVCEGARLPLAEVSERLLGSAPELLLHFETGRSAAIFAGVAALDLDVGFAEGPAPDASFEARALGDTELRIVVPPAWSAALRDAGWADLAARPWCFASPDCSYHRVLEQLCHQHSMRPELRFVADHEGLALDFVRQGLAVTIVERLVAEAAARRGEVSVWPGFAGSVGLHLVALRRRLAEPAIAAFLEACVSRLDAPPSHRGSDAARDVLRA
jgi:DNA-binding transcriptional LysR family regulator